MSLSYLHNSIFQVQISENAMFLINLHVGYRLVDLMLAPNPVVREKVCLILTILATYDQGRKQITSRSKIVDNLMWMIQRDRREIRYAAAYTLRTLARDRCSSEFLLTCENIIENLLRVIKNDYTGIVLLHLKTLESLIEWDPERPLKANAFQIMLELFSNPDPRIVCGAIDCMTQLCKHHIGEQLADIYDLTLKLRPFLVSPSIEIRISAVGLMEYTTLTVRSKWRAKECCEELTKRLVGLCVSSNKPALQLRSMQVLINLCDCPDIRNHLKRHWERKVKGIKIRSHEEWDGTTETTSYGLETGHNYRTMCIEGVETIKNDYGDNAEVINVHSYLGKVHEIKARLLYAMNWKSFKDE